MASDKSKLIYDFLGSFPQGMNSGIDPLLLSKGQMAYAQNGTVRGDFFRQRPAYRTISLSYDSVPTQNNFQTGLFQGLGYYQPDTGPQSIVTAIAGRLFQIIPDTGTGAAIADLTGTNQPNPANITQAWLFQAENYIIWNDGTSVPFVFDGTTLFHTNNGLNAVWGVVNVAFTIPAIGSIINITLANPFAGTLGQSIFIGDATYKTVAPSGTNQANLLNYGDVAGTVYPAGTPIFYNQNVLLYVNSPTAEGWAGGAYPANAKDVAPGGDVEAINCVGNYAGPLGVYFTLNGVVWQIIGSIDADGTTHGMVSGIADLPLLTNPLACIVNTQTIPAGWTTTLVAFQPVVQNGSNKPVITVGILSSSLTVPPQGVSVTANLTANYTGPSSENVTINGNFYTIIALTPAAPGPLVLTVLNENDTPGGTVAIGTNIYSIPQLPAARMGTYGMGRIWLCLSDGLRFIASDIVGGASGTLQNNFRDAVLNIAENDYLAGGGAFRVPGSVGDIKAMLFVALLDASLGQGPLQILTGENIFACQAPADRATWASLTYPILVESLKGSGGISQAAASLANGDLIFRSADGNVRSLLMARLDFNRWGNTPISHEMQRVLDLENKSLLSFDSSTAFDNRFLLAAMPAQGLRGVYFPSILALNFDPLSSLREKQQSVWDGEWTGLNVLSLVSGTFNGVLRCFALCLSTDLTQIELHEILLTGTASYDDGSTPIPTYFESPVLDFGDRKGGGHTYKRLAYGEVYLDGIVGPVTFKPSTNPTNGPTGSVVLMDHSPTLNPQPSTLNLTQASARVSGCPCPMERFLTR